MRRTGLVWWLVVWGCASPYAEQAEGRVEVPAADLGESAVATMDPPPPRRPAAPRGAPIPVRADAPPIAGGTLLLTRDGLLVAGDELTDTIFVVDPDALAIVTSFPLVEGAMPGRMTEDDAGTVHAIARGTGELLRFDPRDPGSLVATKICAAPRGIDFHDGVGLLRVACAEGALLGLTPDHVPRERWELDPDLRDVVASRDRVFVTRFRSAELLVLDGAGALVRRTAPPEQTFLGVTPPAVMVPRVAWRMRASTAGGGVLVSHQRQVSTDLGAIATRADSGVVTYYGSAGGLGTAVPRFVLEQRITRFDGEGEVIETRGTAAGARHSQLVDLEDWRSGVVGAWASDGGVGVARLSEDRFAVLHQDAEVLLGIHTYESDDLHVYRDAPLEGLDLGRQVFHSGSAAGIACASCHPEGGEDGHTWTTPEEGPRRSQSLLGGLSGTAPFHWGGELESFEALMDVQGERLLRTFDARERTAMLGWLDRQPTAASGIEESRASAEAFAAAGCDGCHAGALRSDGESHDVGAGAVQTPRLGGVFARAPFFHDGCAETLEATVDGSCRDLAAHGVADPLLRARVVAHLRSL